MLPKIADFKQEDETFLNKESTKNNGEIRYIPVPVLIPYPVYVDNINVPSQEKNMKENSNSSEKNIEKTNRTTAKRKIQKVKRMKRRESNLTKRTSAAKKYVGQIVVGLARYILKENENGDDSIATELKEFVKDKFLGKKDQAYKVSKSVDFFNLINVSHQDTLQKSALKNRLKEKTINFFQDVNYLNWIKNEFKGLSRGKLWLIINKGNIQDRLIFNKLVNFDCVEKLSDGEVTEKLKYFI